MAATWSTPIPLGPPATVELRACGIEADVDRTRRPPYEAVFRALDSLAVDETARISVDHDPEPLLEALDAARPGEFVWEPLLQGPMRWVGVLRHRRPDERPIPVRRLSPRLARRVTATGARSRLTDEMRSIALDLIGPSDPAALPASAAAWVETAVAEAVEAVGDLSLARLVERLDSVLASAPPEIAHRVDAVLDCQEAGIL